MTIRNLFGFIIFLLPFFAYSENCNPAPPNVAELVEVRSNFYRVNGPLADFDPCHKSVVLNFPFGAHKPPLMIIAHGGSGLGVAERNIAYVFRRLGFVTLIFDSYEMNGLYKQPLFWGTKVSNSARQRMNYKATLSAYKWALSDDRIDNSKIYFYGLSNGAATVTNIAGTVDPTHVKAVFAEGLMSSGLGLPDKLNVPVRLIFGRLDNYGGRNENEWRWLIEEKCEVNGLFDQPQGSAQNCNFSKNAENLTISPINWYENQRKESADIEIWWLEDAAHGVFVGPLNKKTMTVGADDVRFAWTGGSNAAKDTFIEKVQFFLNSKK